MHPGDAPAVGVTWPNAAWLLTGPPPCNCAVPPPRSPVAIILSDLRCHRVCEC
jgi:hypothetical protein